MSDTLKEKVRLLVYHRGETKSADQTTDAILAIVEREAVERERRAALEVLQKYSCESRAELLEYVESRYPAPKEGK